MLLVLLTLSLAETTTGEYFDINLIPNITDYGSITINWGDYDYKDKVFKIFRSTNSETFEQASIDYTLVTNISVLHVFPISNAQYQISSWAKSFGRGIINVKPVYITYFNQNPLQYLKNSNGEWIVDVIIFGTWDANNGNDISTNVIGPLNEFIGQGRGVIFGHDCIVIAQYFSNPNFNSFAHYLNIRVDYFVQIDAIGTQVYAKKKNLITEYPWKLQVGKIYNIPLTHNSKQIALNLDNIKFYLVSNILNTRPEESWYILSNNNVAIIQTGHSSGTATEDEQKIIMNVIFSCFQLLIDKYQMNDYSAMDYAAPKEPEVIGCYRKYDISCEDQCSEYYFYVESYNKHDTSPKGLNGKSPTKKTEICTGIKEYYYTFDNISTTIVATSNSERTNKTTIFSKHRVGYLHIAAMDNAGNLGATKTVEIKYVPKTQKMNFARKYEIMR